MSPFRMWLNSCPITPCSSSRVSFSSAPRVTMITASFGSVPAASALIARSPSSAYTGGTATPEAIAISSTTLSRRDSAGVMRLRRMRRASSSSATASPPARSCQLRQSVAATISASVPPATQR